MIATLPRLQDILCEQQRRARIKFDSNQPRVPAGSPDGGQWTDGGSAESISESMREQWVSQWVRSDSDFYQSRHAELQRWASGESNPRLDAIAQHTQEQLQQQNISSVKAYRGISLPVDHPLAQALTQGHVKIGDTIRLDNIGAASWSESQHVANQFRTIGTGDVSLVMERIVSLNEIVAMHGISPGFQAQARREQELIATSSKAQSVRIVDIHEEEELYSVRL